ncbi:MAG: histidine kinase, partial [Deltaproteobacteria bacterium]|nr:histidine kinase [Deltaproteobacteria bacterium]
MSANSLFEVKTGISLAKDEERAVQELFDQIDQPNSEDVIFFCSSEYKLDRLGKALKARFRC